jgi:hypothetical protein
MKKGALAGSLVHAAGAADDAYLDASSKSQVER